MQHAPSGLECLQQWTQRRLNDTLAILSPADVSSFWVKWHNLLVFGAHGSLFLLGIGVLQFYLGETRYGVLALCSLTVLLCAPGLVGCFKSIRIALHCTLGVCLLNCVFLMQVLPAVVPFLWLSALGVVRVGTELDWSIWAVLTVVLQAAQLGVTLLSTTELPLGWRAQSAVTLALGMAATCMVYYSSWRDLNDRAAARLDTEAAQRANSTKNVFLAMMSHEIRTPLHGILSLCELLMASGAVLSPSPPGVATVYASATDQVPTAVVPPPNAASLRTKSPGGDSMHNEGPAHGTLAASPASPIPGAQAMSFSRLYSQISQASPDVPKQQREDIFNIQALAQHLLSLVEDLLDVSRIEAREITLDQGTVLVPEIMKRILLALQSRAKARNIDIKTHISPGACGAFIGAPSRLQQVITNLVGNAVKFSRINSTVTANITLTSSVTDAGGFGSSDHKLHTHPDEPQHFSSPSIKSSAAANANANGAAGASEARSPTGSIRRSSSKVSPTAVPPLNVLEAVCLSPRSNVPPMPAPGADEDWVTLHVSVHDQGDGIDQGNMNKLFQPFSQVDSSSQRKFQGSGLGLYICANLIKMMHGSLIVKSRVGVGSSFAFTVKLRTLAAMSQVTVVDVADSRSLLWRGTRRTASVSGAEGFAIGKSSRSGLHITRRQDSTGTQLLLQTRLARNASTGAPALMALSDETTVEMMQPLALSSPPVLLPGCLSDTPLSEAFVLHDKPVPVHSEGLLSQPVACVCASPAGAAAVAAESALEGKRQHNRGKAATSPTSRNKRAAPVRSPKTLHASAAAAAEVAKKARFLVVEDNVVNQKLAVRMLSALSALYECVTADDGEQAVALFREQCFDFVFMDCQMPVMDGFGATRAIRTMEYQKAQSDAQSRDRRRVPIVALTANAMSSDRTACLEAGMDDFLAKPFSGAALEAVISRWLPLKSALPV